MRTSGRNLGWLVLAGALLVPGAAMAHEAGDPGAGACPGCGRMAGRGQRAFDPQAVTTVRGRIVEVQRVARGRHEGVHLQLAVGSEAVVVRLGPGFWVDRQDLKLASGDEVEVTGSRTTLGGQATIVAQEVRRGEQVLALRDASGVPLWRGQGMGRR